jgi:hypothetical protein
MCSPVTSAISNFCIVYSLHWFLYHKVGHRRGDISHGSFPLVSFCMYCIRYLVTILSFFFLTTFNVTIHICLCDPFCHSPFFLSIFSFSSVSYYSLFFGLVIFTILIYSMNSIFHIFISSLNTPQFMTLSKQTVLGLFSTTYTPKPTWKYSIVSRGGRFSPTPPVDR